MRLSPAGRIVAAIVAVILLASTYLWRLQLFGQRYALTILVLTVIVIAAGFMIRLLRNRSRR
jgi:hypothetical protein